MSDKQQFAHLHLHSSYSLTDGLLHPAELAAAAVQRNISAVALTDCGNLFGFISFYRAMEKAGVKPICGVEMEIETEAGDFAELVLLARNEEGYRNLMRLVSKAYTDESFNGMPRLQRAWLTGAVAGLSALSGGHKGEVGKLLVGNDALAAHECLQRSRDLFDGEFYLQISRIGWGDEQTYLPRAVDLAAKTDCPLIASNDVRFLDREDFDLHEARTCIARKWELSDEKRPRLYREAQYFASAQEMQALFKDVPEAVENASALAQRCNLTLASEQLHMPVFKLPKGQNEADWMRTQVDKGLKSKLRVTELPSSYRERMDYELGVIERMGFTGYFLVVCEFVSWARANDVIVGPGRGSGAGALVSWALGITDLDPLEYGLLFERFLNPERVSPPDLDIDFDPSGRGKVIQHVVEVYGREAVAQIATTDFAQARAAIHDATRVLGYPPSQAHHISKLFPHNEQYSVLEAEQNLPQLQKMATENGVRQILDLAAQVEGLPRNASRHAGGIVIAPKNLTNYAPLFRVRGEDWVATQYDKDDLEAVGLVKFDFLGLATLTIIDDALTHVAQLRAKSGEPPLLRGDMALDDASPYDLICSGETEGLFQLESPRMRSLIQRFAPRTFSDLIALLALIRPGPLEAGMFNQAVRCRTGQEKITPPHPLLAEVVQDTWGVMLYQEQVMEAARRLAGYSYGEADQLRRAMGKKDREEMARHQSIFVEKAGRRDIRRWDAEKVFEQIEKFAGYGFNKSHSAAYAVLSFQTAWLKAHYPTCFMAATMTQEMQAPERERRGALVRACRRLGLEVLPPDVNASNRQFSVESERTLRFGLEAVKGVGKEPGRAIVSAREQDGRFSNLNELCLRAKLHQIDSRVLHVLNDAGALRSLDANPAALEANIEGARVFAELRTREQQTRQGALFAAPAAEEESAAAVATGHSEPPPAWTCDEWSARERRALSLYLEHHPLTYWRRELEPIKMQRIANMGANSGGGKSVFTMAVRVGSLRAVTRGERTFWFVDLDDETDSFEAEVPEHLVPEAARIFVANELLLADVEYRPASDKSRRPRMQLRQVERLQQTRRRRAHRLVVRLEGEIPQSCMAELQNNAHKQDGCPLVFQHRFLEPSVEMEGDIEMPPEWAQPINEPTMDIFRRFFGVDNVWYDYNR